MSCGGGSGNLAKISGVVPCVDWIQGEIGTIMGESAWC